MKNDKIFIWRAINANGNKIEGEIYAKNLVFAKVLLKQQGLQIEKIQQKLYLQQLFFYRRISYQEIKLFTQQLYILLNAGVSLIKAIKTIACGLKNTSFQQLLNTISVDISEGHSFSDSLLKHPKVFSKIYIHMIKIAEQTGSMADTLGKLAIDLEKQHLIRKKIQKALLYPTTIFFVAVIVSIILLIFVIPGFKNLYSDFGAQLPLLTREVIAVSEILQKYYLRILLLIFLITAGFTYLKRAHTKFNQFLQKNILLWPIIGNICNNALLARISQSLAVTFSAGVPLISALRLIADNCNNIVYTKALQNITNDIAAGLSLNKAMQNRKLFPDLVLQMVLVGEESGNLETMLYKIADFYEHAIDDSISILSSLCEPLIILILGFIVGGLVMAMYLPIFKLGSIT